MGVHILSVLAEAAGAFGALMNNDAHFDPLSASYRAWYAVGVATAAATVISMLVWLRGPGRVRRGQADPGRLSNATSLAHLCWGMLVLGALISTAGYVMAAVAADDHAGETLSATNRLGADMILAGTLVDLIGSLVVLVGAVCCLLLLRRRSQVRTGASAEGASTL